jgi:hypothetical protein
MQCAAAVVNQNSNWRWSRCRGPVFKDHVTIQNEMKHLSRSYKEGTRKRRILSLVVLLLLTFGTFRFFPEMAVIQESWYMICFLYFFVYLRQQSKDQRKLSAFEIYLIALVVIVPVLSAVSAWREFGQPIVIGLLRQRGMIGIAAVLFCMRALRMRFFTLSEVKAALLILAWGTAFVWVFMRTLLNAADYVDYSNNPGFVGEGDVPRFVLQEYFIVFGVLYYALRGLRTGKAKNYLLALLLLPAAYNDVGGRQMTIALLLSFLFFVVRWTELTRLLVTLPATLLAITALLGLLYFVKPQMMADRFSQFRDAFVVAFTGEPGENGSANGRISQVLFAIDGIEKHPLLGNGALSGQWEGGAQEVFGQRFYADDIGLIGAIYTYGFCGLILFSIQYWLLVRRVNSLTSESNNSLIDGLKGFVLYTLFVSLGTGLFVFSSVVSLFCVMVICSIADGSGFLKAGSALMTGPRMSNGSPA